MEWITNPEIWVSLLTLTVLEIILGIDNIVFITILAGKLPQQQQARARQTGLSLALITRVLFRTSKSSGDRNSPSSANLRCSIRCSRRWSTIIRESSRRGRGRRAISPSGKA